MIQESPRDPAVETAARRVVRAMADLRRGWAVRVEAAGTAVLVVAVETALPAVLLDLEARAGATPRLLLTRERARASGLVPQAAAAVMVAPPADAAADWAQRLAWGSEIGRAVPPGATQATPAPASTALELARMARLVPALLVLTQTERVADADALSVSAEDVAAYPGVAAERLELTGEARVPLAEDVESRFVLFRELDGLTEHVAIVVARPPPEAPVLVRVHSACFTGDLFASLRCDCGEQLRGTVRTMAHAGGGVLLYLAQEGRGIGLSNKLRAYGLQDTGLDTLDADAHLGFRHDERRYEVAVAMLRQLGVSRVRLMTNNPAKLRALERAGIEIVARIPIIAPVNPHNLNYLRVKADRAGHMLDGRRVSLDDQP